LSGGARTFRGLRAASAASRLQAASIERENGLIDRHLG
jgi:hypothetical protein